MVVLPSTTPCVRESSSSKSYFVIPKVGMPSALQACRANDPAVRLFKTTKLAKMAVEGQR